MSDVVGRKLIRLRYAGSCRGCGIALERGVEAEYEPASRSVRCLACVTGDSHAAVDVPEGSPPVSDTEVTQGRAGESARREHGRRTAKRESAIRAAHPKLGGLILALTDEPQSTRAWERGAVGEERLGATLDSVASPTIRVLHDRRIPGTRANIDHIVVCATGVVVIDAKRYRGRPSLRVEGGILRPRVERLVVGGRDCTRLVDGVLRQADRVSKALDRDHPGTAVLGMLCFVDADWPLIGGSFTTRDVHILWPKRAATLLQEPGALAAEQISALTLSVSAAFPHA